MQGPLLALMAVAAYGALHSLLASMGAKARARSAIGPAADRIYRLAFNLVALVTFLPVMAIPALDPGRTLYVVPWPWSAVMIAGQLAAALVVLAGLLQTDPWHFLGLRQLGDGVSGAPPTLVTTGLYRHVRHPLYTAGAVFLWLTPILTTTLLALYAALTAYLYLGTFHEERRLRAEFGVAYVAYQRRVPRLIPRLPFPRNNEGLSR